MRNMVIREVVQMMEQLQPQNVERNDEWSRTVPEPKVRSHVCLGTTRRVSHLTLTATLQETCKPTQQERLADSCPRKQGSGKKEHSQTQKAPGKNCPVLSAPIRIWVIVWVRDIFEASTCT